MRHSVSQDGSMGRKQLCAAAADSEPETCSSQAPPQVKTEFLTVPPKKNLGTCLEKKKKKKSCGLSRRGFNMDQARGLRKRCSAAPFSAPDNRPPSW
jgi:hypothetical protein